MIDAIVTGAGGFIGQALCAELRARSWNLLPLTSSNGDVATPSTWNRLPAARVVFHLAGRSFVPDSWMRGPDFVTVNVAGCENALEYCRKNMARLVLASAYVYGIPNRLPIREGDPTFPNNPYALSKRMAEQLCEFGSQYQGITTTALRIFNVFGPGQRTEFLIPKILQQLHSMKEIRLLDLAPRRDYVYLSDVVDAFIKAGEIDRGFKVINIASGQSLSVADIVDRIQLVAGTRLPVVSEFVERHQDIPDVSADISLAHQELGWKPKLSFEEGIAQLLKSL